MCPSRHALPDRAWALVVASLPVQTASRGRPWRNHRQVVGGILWVLATGGVVRDAPTCFGPWQTLYARFARWSDDGTWHRLLSAFRTAVERAGCIDWGLACVDGTSVRATHYAAMVARALTVRTARYLSDTT